MDNHIRQRILYKFYLKNILLLSNVINLFYKYICVFLYFTLSASPMWLGMEPMMAHTSCFFFLLGAGFYPFTTSMDLGRYIRTHSSISMDRYSSEQTKSISCVE